MAEKEYIEREALSQAILDLPPKMDEQGYGWLGRRGVWQMVNDFPAADVRPVVKGKWEEVEVSYIEDMYDKWNLPEAIVSMYCPICERYHNEVYWYGNPTENINFCPNCGARMEENNERN